MLKLIRTKSNEFFINNDVQMRESISELREGKILLIEDNEGYYGLFQKTYTQGGIVVYLYTDKKGQKVIIEEEMENFLDDYFFGSIKATILNKNGLSFSLKL